MYVVVCVASYWAIYERKSGLVFIVHTCEIPFVTFLIRF